MANKKVSKGASKNVKAEVVCFRQGDVAFRKVSKLPEGLKKMDLVNNRVIVGFGETSGHTHGFEQGAAATLYANEDGSKRYVSLEKPADLVHDEHTSISFEPGVFEVIQQKEYVAAAPARSVRD